MKNIYIVLSHSGTKISKFFRLLTKAEYTHTSICLDDSFRTFYSFARRNIRFPIFGGFVEEHPGEGVLEIYPAKCKIYKLSITDEQYRGIKEDIKKMFDDYENYKYNFIGVPLIGLGISLKRKKRFTCTQFVGYVLSHNGINIIDVPWELSKPQDFNKPNINTIYEGWVKDLKV